jgi:hypothetical protein
MVCGHEVKEQVEMHCDWTAPYNKNSNEVNQQALIKVIKIHASIKKKINSRTQKLREETFSPLDYQHCYLARNLSITTMPVTVKSRGIVILARPYLFNCITPTLGGSFSWKKNTSKSKMRKTPTRVEIFRRG